MVTKAQAKAKKAKAKKAQAEWPDVPVKFWRLSTVLKYTARSRSSIYRAVAAGEFPAPVKLGPNTSAFIADEVIVWGVDRIAESRGHADSTDAPDTLASAACVAIAGQVLALVDADDGVRG